MAITPSDVKQRRTTKDPDELIQADIDTADALLVGFIDDDLVRAAIPEVIYDAALMAVTLELYNQRKAPNGVANQQYASDGGVIAVESRVSRDPLLGAYPILRDFVSPVGFA